MPEEEHVGAGEVAFSPVNLALEIRQQGWA